MPYIVRIKKHFHGAHFLTYYKGGPEPLHGHTFAIEVYIESDILDEGGVSIDFVEVDKYLDSVLPNYKLLNDVFDFSPSAENLAKYFFDLLKNKYNVKKVVVWETENCASEYYE